MKKVIFILSVACALFACKKEKIEEINPRIANEVNMFPLSREFYNQKNMLTNKENYIFEESRLIKATSVEIDALSIEKINGWWNFEYNPDGNIKRVLWFNSGGKQVLLNSFTYVEGKISSIIRWQNVGDIFGDTLNYIYNQNNDLVYYTAKSYGFDPNPNGLNGGVHRDSVLVSKTITSVGYDFEMKPFSFDFKSNSYLDPGRTDKLQFNNVEHSYIFQEGNTTSNIQSSKIKSPIYSMNYVSIDNGSTENSIQGGAYRNFLTMVKPETNIWNELPLKMYFQNNNASRIEDEILVDSYGRVVLVTSFVNANNVKSLSYSQRYIY